MAAVFVAGLATACSTTHREGGLEADLGERSRAVTTVSADAQRWYDQGLVWLYAFNHDEAIHCFSEALEIDPGFAMAWWGIACANGPHINNPMVPPERDGLAREAVKRARTLAKWKDIIAKAGIKAEP